MKSKIYIECKGKNQNGNLIEIFPDVIKSILNDLMSNEDQNDFSIDASSFDNASNETTGMRRNWKAAMSLSSTNLKTLLNDFAKNSAVCVVKNHLNKLILIVLNSSETDNQITIDDLGKGNDVITISEIPATYNSFCLHYYYDHVLNRFGKIEFVNKDDTSLSDSENVREGLIDTYTGLCLESFNKTGGINKYVFESKYIRERDTALNLLKWFIEWFGNPKYNVKLKMIITPNTIKHEIGDQTKLSLGISGFSSNNFIITKLETNYFEDIINVELLEMKDV